MLRGRGQRHRIDLFGLTGRRAMDGGQTEVTHDLMDRRAAQAQATVYEAQDRSVHDFDVDSPHVHLRKDRAAHEIECDFIASSASGAALLSRGLAERFSWRFTMLMHMFPENGAFGEKMKRAELDGLFSSRAAQTAVAENQVGLALQRPMMRVRHGRPRLRSPRSRTAAPV